MSERLTRPLNGDIGGEVLAALDRLGITPGAEYEVSPPATVADVNENDLGRWRTGAAETARKAALDNYPRSGKQRHQVLVAVYDEGMRGATSDEIAAKHRIRLYSVKPRLIELREGGWVVGAGERPSETGSMVEVFVATDKAVRAIEDERAGRKVVVTPPPKQSSLFA